MYRTFYTICKSCIYRGFLDILFPHQISSCFNIFKLTQMCLRTDMCSEKITVHIYHYCESVKISIMEGFILPERGNKHLQSLLKRTHFL